MTGFCLKRRGHQAGECLTCLARAPGCTGLPISTTHTLVGAVLGVGLARGIGALNLGVIRSIFMSWIITLPVGAVLAVIFYYVLTTLML